MYWFLNGICTLIERIFRVRWSLWVIVPYSGEFLVSLILMAVSVIFFLLLIFRKEHGFGGYIGPIVIIACSALYSFLWMRSYFHIYSNGLWGSVVGTFTLNLLREYSNAPLPPVLYLAVIMLGSIVASIMISANPIIKKRLWY